jgi:branched-chain amino acid transport system ATP-binding protein
VSLIEVKDVIAGYGGAPILNGVNISIEQSDIGVIVGPNGAGKSTTLKAIFGLLKVSQGSITFGGEAITNALPDKLVPRGLSFVPQEKNVFTSMTVEENLEMGAFTRRDDFSSTIKWVYDMFPVLREKRRQPAGELSGGQRQMVAMGRALMSQPRLLMLDEPSAGLSPRYVIEIFEQIVKVNKAGVGILMVEQNARQALAFASRGFVLANGQNRFTGTGPELIADPEVARSFLGGGEQKH